MKKPNKQQLNALNRLASTERGLKEQELLQPSRITVNGKPVVPTLSLDDIQTMEDIGLIEKVEGKETRYVATALAQENLPAWKQSHYHEVFANTLPKFDFSGISGFQINPIATRMKPLGLVGQNLVSEAMSIANPFSSMTTSLMGAAGAASWVKNTGFLDNKYFTGLASSLQILKIANQAWMPNLDSGNYLFTHSQTRDILNSFEPVLDWVQKIREYKGWAEPLWGESLGRLSLLIAEEGIPLMGACPPELVTQLLAVENVEQREQILLEHDQEILELCQAVISQCSAGQEQLLAQEAIESYRAELYRSAQALNACLLDPLCNDYIRRLGAGHLEELYGEEFPEGKLPIDWYLKKKQVDSDKQVRFPVEIQNRFYKESVVNQLIFPLFLNTLHSFGNNTPPPRIFNRHATAHRGLENHFTPINSLRSIMTVTAAIWGKNPVDYEDLVTEEPEGN